MRLLLPYPHSGSQLPTHAVRRAAIPFNSSCNRFPQSFQRHRPDKHRLCRGKAAGGGVSSLLSQRTEDARKERGNEAKVTDVKTRKALSDGTSRDAADQPIPGVGISFLFSPSSRPGDYTSSSSRTSGFRE